MLNLISVIDFFLLEIKNKIIILDDFKIGGCDDIWN